MSVIVGEIATEQDPRSHKPEVVRGHKTHMDLFRLAVVAGQREGEREDAREALEFVFGGFAQIDKVSVGKGKVLDAAIAHVGGDDDELIGIFVREGAQEHGVGNAEDGSACADTQRNG